MNLIAFSTYWLLELAARCDERGVRFVVVLPPMAGLVRTEVCDVYGITGVMENEVLPRLEAQSFPVLDYEWGGSCIQDDDTQFFDGFHLCHNFRKSLYICNL